MSETIKAQIRAAANRVLNPLGLHLSRRDRAFEMDGLLARVAARQLAVATWIDVGASDGSWSLKAQRYFPAAKFLLFEPLAEREAALSRLHTSRGFHHVAAAAGAKAGSVAFSVDPQLDGSGVAASGEKNARTVPVETIDHAVGQLGLPGPYALKLDTHGYEIPVLEGAAKTLSQASLLVIEAYNFVLTPGSLRFHELCAWLEARGFRCCDVADPMRRPSDGAFWQIDLAFAPSSSPLFQSDGFGK
ncbi:MAG: hypothetical protein JWM32_138 [Verrucomicrobia bacterium]|nr:hypothetical protein [Verrucomicrobiota bacterium]